MQITRCLHTAILVSDLEKAEHFYGTVLGLSKVDRSLTFSGIWYQIGEYQIHLIVTPDLEITRHNREKWGRNPHIALAVEDLDKMRSHLQDCGYKIQMSASGRAALFVSDPDGNIIEISAEGGTGNTSTSSVHRREQEMKNKYIS